MSTLLASPPVCQIISCPASVSYLSLQCLECYNCP